MQEPAPENTPDPAYPPLPGPWGAVTRIARLALLLAFTGWVIWMLYAHPPGVHASC